MNDTPVAGTFRLDGMIQGPLPPDIPVTADIKAWVMSAKASGLNFHLSVDGGGFSIVTDPCVQATSRLAKPDLEALLCDALDALLTLLPLTCRGGVYSTVRSEEFRPGIALQTLFTAQSDGTFASEQRVVQVETQTPPPEITAASIRRAAVPALIVLILVLLGSMYFIDYHKLFSAARDRVVPLTKEEVTVNQTALGKAIEVELVGIDSAHNALLFQLKRGSDWNRALSSSPQVQGHPRQPEWPTWNRALSSPPQETPANWPDFLMRLAIHQSRLRIELYDKDDKMLSSGELCLDPLKAKPSAQVAVIVTLSERLAKIVIRP